MRPTGKIKFPDTNLPHSWRSFISWLPLVLMYKYFPNMLPKWKIFLSTKGIYILVNESRISFESIYSKLQWSLWFSWNNSEWFGFLIIFFLLKGKIFSVPLSPGNNVIGVIFARRVLVHIFIRPDIIISHVVGCYPSCKDKKAGNNAAEKTFVSLKFV